MPAVQRLFLIDGYALIYRAFFAMIARPLRTSRGENTSAVWGVANFLHRLFASHHPDFVAWIHDAGTSFRSEVYTDYKATREKLDEELQEDFDRSIDRIESLLAAFRVALVEVEGYEADDVIGTLASHAVDAGFQVVIVSGDKDFYQLIAPQVTLLNPGRGGPAGVDEQWVDPSNAEERMGIPPERVVDYLALVGDSSDNIPGVRGIGDKTARSLIAAYGDLDEILTHAENVKGKRAREALLAEADNARLSRALVTIQREVPVTVDLEDLRARTLDASALADLYTELEFHSLLRKLETAVTTTQVSTQYELVTQAKELAAIIDEVRRADVVALSVESVGAEPVRADVIGCSLAVGTGRAWYFPLAHRAPEGQLTTDSPPGNLPSLTDPSMRPLVELLQDPGVTKAGYDVKHMRLVLRRAGIELRGVVFDAMLASFVLDPGRRSHTLGVLARDQLGTQLRSSEWAAEGKGERSFAEVPPAEALAYSCVASDTVLRLRDAHAPQLDTLGLRPLLENVELPLVDVLVEMEWRGIGIDTDRLATLSQRFGTELAEIERAIHTEAGTEFNINSTPQLRHILFEKLNLPVIKRTKTGPSTDADVLVELAGMGFALPQHLLDYRELSKLKSTYVDVLPESVNPDTGRIHTSYSQIGASTGRLSSADPNLQNIPVRTARGEEIRRCFVPAAGSVFIVADYSQIELRLLAHLSQDPAFINAFARGGDIHRETAAIIFDVPGGEVTSEMRARAKTINFATIYGQGPFSLSRQLGITQEEATEFIRLYFERFAGVRHFLDESVERARRLGYSETLFGRRRYIPELKDRTYRIRSFGERVAMNAPLQGSAADLIKLAMINLAKALTETGVNAAILLQVHDELVLEAEEQEVEAVRAIVRREMEGAAELSVPLTVEVGIGPNWLEAKA